MILNQRKTDVGKTNNKRALKIVFSYFSVLLRPSA